jgi:hypothetical protein
MEIFRVYAVALFGLLSGAAVVHSILRPDLRLPVDSAAPTAGASAAASSDKQ